MATAKKSLYDILGVDPDANELDIGLAYERRRDELARRVPPDESGSALVQQAYEVLSNPTRRTAYDASLVTAQERAAAAEQPTDLLLEEEPTAKRRNPIWVGGIAGLVVIVAALYFTFRSPHEAAPPQEKPAEPPKPVVHAPAPPKPLSAAAVLTRIASSVGTVLAYDMGGKTKPLGLATQIERGVFVTTCHGIPAGSALVVRIALESHSARLSVNDERLDLCKLSVPDLQGAGVPLAREEPKAGDKLFVVGANAKGEIALTDAKVKELRASASGNVIEVDVPVAPNGSGGAAFDVYGDLVGIATNEHGFGRGVEAVLPASWFAQMRTRTKPQ
jgi:hypothetical protein